MLIHKNAQAGEAAAGETRQITTDVGFLGGGIEERQVGHRLSIPEASKADVVAVRLYSSTRTRSISRVMPASSDFSTSPTLLLIFIPLRSNGMWLPVTITPARPVEMACETNAGVGILPAFSTLAARVDNRLSAGAHDAVGARPEVAGNDHCAARTNIVDAQQIAERSFDIDIGLEVGDVFDQAAQSAGAKGQRDRRVIKKRSRGVYSRFGYWSHVVSLASEKKPRHLAVL